MVHVLTLAKPSPEAFATEL